MIVEGRLLEGSDYAGGELGHVTIVPDGLVCGCGNRGCVEAYASATGIVARTKASASGTLNYLGIAVAGMVNVFNPDVVSFSGGVARWGRMLFEPLRAEVKRRAFRALTKRLRIVRSRLGDNVGVIGAARAAMLALGNDPAGA